MDKFLGQVNTNELRRFIVRIDTVDGTTRGTGFFVAPGWVLTCAHVVREDRELAVVPASLEVRLDGKPWRVAARSAPLQPGHALWPYPDLALLRAEGDPTHPCALLEIAEPAHDVACTAWGFSRREHGVAPPGSPAVFHYEGVEGDGFLRLRHGQAAPGLSGAPLVCPRRRAVVGVVCASRDPTTDLGAWAAPLSDLLHGRNLPDELSELGPEIREQNRAAVRSDPTAWHRVIPIDARDVLEQPWAEFTRAPRSVPSDLLKADYGVVPYLFRDAQVREIVSWCTGTPEPLALTQIAGAGGAGKTRLAIQVCKELEGRGWVAGFLRDKDQPERLPLPRLAVVDYAENRPALQDILEALRRNASDIAPVRILLLTRIGARRPPSPIESLLESARGQLHQVLTHTKDDDLARQPLSIPQRSELYREAYRAFDRCWNQRNGQEHNAAEQEPPDLTDARYRLPLDVLFEAFDAVLGGTPPDPERQRRQPVDRVLEHEQRYWQSTVHSQDEYLPLQQEPPDLLRRCLALATLAEAATPAEADQLLGLLPELAGEEHRARRAMIIRWLASLYPGPKTLNALRPDRLGEELLIRVRREMAQGAFTSTSTDQSVEARTLLDAVRTLSDDQITRCLEVLAQISAYDIDAASLAAQALARIHEYLVQRAEQQARGRPERPGRVQLAGALRTLLADQFCELLVAVEPDNTGFQRDLSVSYDRLADVARAVGDGGEARRLYQRGLDIREALVAVEPDNTGFQRALSVSYGRLADVARAVGDGGEARRLYQRGLDIREALVAVEPDNTGFQRALSVSYERLAALDADDEQQSVQVAQWLAAAIDIRQRLLRQEPDRIDLAEELAGIWYLTGTIDASDVAVEHAKAEVCSILEPFEQRGTLTRRASDLLSWSRA